MNFLSTLSLLETRFAEQGVTYALIGGFAMALRGVQRMTADLDFLVMLEDLPEADAILSALGYRRIFHSENVSHYEGENAELGRVDVLHAFRGPSLGMLQRAELLPVTPEVSVRVAQVEDLIGLKVQALSNNPSRALGDWHDVYMLVQAAGAAKNPLDWDLLGEYLSLFGQEARLEELCALYREQGA